MFLRLHRTHTPPARAASVAALLAELLSANQSMDYVSTSLSRHCCATLGTSIGIGSYQTRMPDLQHRLLWQLDLHLHSLRVHVVRPEHAWLLQMMSV